jgi:diguanylate cyclase (GGDEF)-like protein
MLTQGAQLLAKDYGFLSAIASARTCHIVMMDLDRFKNVNDVLGQSFGDALLRSVAQRLVTHNGAELLIDDFGAGYSSLAYLEQLPVDELKIDKSFVMNMEHDANNANIVRSTIDLGHNLGLRVVAEATESEQVWDLLSQIGCDRRQGYLMNRPIPANEFGAAGNTAHRQPVANGQAVAVEIGEVA